MPAHDSAAVIGQALGSVLGQTYRDWELLIADDASADGTAARVRALAPQARVLHRDANGGPAAARNLALAHATGELVAFLDADDWWEPAYLERQLARYDAESARGGAPVGIVACDARIADADGIRPGTYCEQFRRVEPVTLERLLRRNVLFVSAVVPRRAGESIGWFDESLFGTEDHDLWIRLLEAGYRAVLNREPLAVYRRTTGSISRNVARQAANNQKTLRAALARGGLSRAQRRIARSELRYNRALEAVALAAFGAGRPAERAAAILRSLPTVAWVATTRPAHWADWVTALRAR